MNHLPQEMSRVEVRTVIELTLQHISTPSHYPIPIVHIRNLKHTKLGTKLQHPLRQNPAKVFRSTSTFFQQFLFFLVKHKKKEN